MPLYGRRNSKPNPGVGVDWSHPLARGLMGFYPLNEGAGPTFRDVVNGIDMTAGKYPASGPWGSGRTIGYAQANATNQYAQAALPAQFRIGYPLTIAVAGRFTGSTTSYSPFFGFTWNDNNNAAQAACLEEYSGWGLAYASGTTRTEIGTGLALDATGTDWVVSATFTNAGQSFYRGGVKQWTHSAAVSNIGWSTNPLIFLGGWDKDSGANGGPNNVIYYWAAWWSRALGDGEQAALAANPWQVFMPPWRPYGAASPTPTAIPIPLLLAGSFTSPPGTP